MNLCYHDPSVHQQLEYPQVPKQTAIPQATQARDMPRHGMMTCAVPEKLLEASPHGALAEDICSLVISPCWMCGCTGFLSTHGTFIPTNRTSSPLNLRLEGIVVDRR